MANKKAAGKYDKYFITEGVIHDALRKEWGGQMISAGAGTKLNDLVSADSRALPAITVIRKPYMFHEPTHTHMFTEYFFFWGSNPNDMNEFDGEAHYSFGPEHEKHIINEPTIVVAAPGVYHCPLNYAKVNKPFYCMELFITQGYKGVNFGEDLTTIRTAEESYDRFFTKGVVKRNKWGGQGMGLASVPAHIIPPNCKVSAAITCVRSPYMFHEPTHKHEKFNEFFYFFGSNPYDMTEFDAEVEFTFGAEKEKHVINKPTIVVAPAGVYHAPLNYKKVNKPFYCVEIFMTATYTGIDLEPAK